MKIPAALAQIIPPLRALGRAIPEKSPAPCQNCGYDLALFLGTEVRPDFDTTAVLTPDLKRAFGERRDGICVRCGIYQAYKRFSLEQLRAINSMGKDISTSEKAFHVHPAPADFVAMLNDLYFGIRSGKWKEYFARVGARPANAFFIRPFFGGSVKFIRETYGARVAGLDMSDTCVRTTADLVPGFVAHQGAINGLLEGAFLDSGPYDSVFVFHTLAHACDIHKMLAQIHGLLAPGGFAVFSHDIVRKPSNPFHMIHLSEIQLRALLLRHFARVDRIDACDGEPPPSISDYTEKGDSPDLVAWRL